MPQSEAGSLWALLSAAGRLSDRVLWGADANVILGDLAQGSSLGGRIAELHGRSVLVATRDQLTAALAFIELDGIARRIVLCPPDLPQEHILIVMATAAVDAVVSDRELPEAGTPSVGPFVTCSPRITPAVPERSGGYQTEWILLTSGTTGLPKMVVHTLSSLTGAIQGTRAEATPVVWSTFYDIRRYGGLQVLLRTLLGSGSMVLSNATESTDDFLTRAGTHAVTHILGTPTHWWLALTSSSAHMLAPEYVRLSGEIANQAILDRLRALYPGAKIVHAFASTEAGVGFEVGDGLAGFPATLVGQRRADVEMKVEDGSLRIRPARPALRYLGSQGEALADADGFVDTRDLVELRGDRYYFVGRRDGVINVGGQKVQPEEIEAVINSHPQVQMSLVRARKNPITGAIVIAEVVLNTKPGATGEPIEGIKQEILRLCRVALPRHKVPAAISFVPSLAVAATGKIARRDA
jgi:acyl-coenzyme A synthetase/AMP-(fatty) acid ligase